MEHGLALNLEPFPRRLVCHIHTPSLNTTSPNFKQNHITMDRFTLFSNFPVEIQDDIWQAAAVNAHDGPRILHLGLFGVDEEAGDKDMLLLVPEASTINETRQIRALSSACHQSRQRARAYLPDTLNLRPGKLWFRDGEDIISFPAEGLSVRRLGINMNDHIRRGLAKIQEKRLDVLADVLHDRVFRAAIMTFYGLKLIYSTADIYAVWEEEDVPGFCSNPEAVSMLRELHSRQVDSINHAFSNRHLLQRIAARRVANTEPLAAVFQQLQVGSAVFSGHGGTESTRIVEIQHPDSA